MKLAISSLLLILFMNSYGQDNQPYSLQKCIELVLHNSYRLKSAEQRIYSAEAVFKQEKTNYLPQIFVEASHDQLLYEPYNFRQQLGELRFDWHVGDFWEQSAQSDHSRFLAQKSQFAQSRLEVTMHTVVLYFDILRSRSQLDLLEKRNDLLKKHLIVSKGLWRSGIKTKLDLIQTEMVQMETEEKILDAESEMNRQRQELARLMGFKDYHQLSLKEYPDTLREYEIFDSTSLAVNVSENPILLALQYQIHSVRLQSHKVKASLFPQIQFKGGYMVDRDPAGEGNYWIGGIGLQLPLFQWNKSSYQLQRIKADANELEARRKSVSRELTIQISNSIDRIGQLKKMLTVQRNQIDKSRQAFQFASVNYEAGLITNLEYLTIQQQLTENKTKLAQTRLQLIQTLIVYYLMTNQEDKISNIYEIN